MSTNVDANSLQFIFEREPTKTTKKSHLAVGHPVPESTL